MSKSEFRFLGRLIIAGLLIFAGTFGLGYFLQSKALVYVATGSLGISLLLALVWFSEASLKSLKQYGLGEGVANLYGEEHAKFMFGEDYKKPVKKDE